MHGDGAAYIKPPFLMIFDADLMPPTSPPILAAIAIALAGLLFQAAAKARSRRRRRRRR